MAAAGYESGKCPEYEGSSSDDGNLTFPRKVSKWTISELNHLGIVYDGASLSLSSFIEQIKSIAWQGHLYECTKSPVIYHQFEEILKETLTFNLQYESKERTSYMLEAENILPLIEEIRKQFLGRAWQYKKTQYFSFEDEITFDQWTVRTHDFILYLAKFQEIRLSCPVRKVQYTDLLMGFSKIFSLQPETGDCRIATLNVVKQPIVCTPDIRFVRYPKAAAYVRTLLVVSTEVKWIGTEDEKTESFNINEKISTHVLGKHGGELLVERNSSYFKPGVLGIICLKTKLVFTFMEMTDDHYNCIIRGDPCDKKHAKIFYTKPYDYWNQIDREEIYSFLFWLGHLQSS